MSSAETSLLKLLGARIRFVIRLYAKGTLVKKKYVELVTTLILSTALLHHIDAVNVCVMCLVSA